MTLKSVSLLGTICQVGAELKSAVTRRTIAYLVYELPARTNAQLGVGLLPGDIVDTNAVFAEVDADEILSAEF